MFNIGDYMVCGGNGVCKVENIGTLEVGGIPNDGVYYTLVPVYASESKVFTPVDNKKIVMRPVISKEEAWDLIDNIKAIETLWIEDDKKREVVYKESLHKYDCKELVRIIKTSYLRQQSRIAEGKKVTAADKKYFQMAEESLYGELAIALEIEKDKVKEYIIERVEGLK